MKQVVWARAAGQLPPDYMPVTEAEFAPVTTGPTTK